MNEALSATEEAVARLWSEVLGITQAPSATANFFALGGNSMAMVLIEYRIIEEFSVELPPGAVLGAPTLRELAAMIDVASAASRKSGA